MSSPRAPKIKKTRKPPPPPTPRATKPWDAPPYPKNGDATDEITYAAIGRSLSAWEYFEGNMAHLFARFLGIGGNQLPATRAYGSVLSFKGRAEMVEAAAEAYFYSKPDSKLKGEVRDLVEAAKRFSPRRNELAHGVVRNFSVPGGFMQSPDGMLLQTLNDWGFAIIPSDYATNKVALSAPRNLLSGIGKSPKYTYTSKEIAIFTAEFIKLGARTGELSHRVLLHSLPPQSPTSP